MIIIVHNTSSLCVIPVQAGGDCGFVWAPLDGFVEEGHPVSVRVWAVSAAGGFQPAKLSVLWRHAEPSDHDSKRNDVHWRFEHDAVELISLEP